MSSKIEESNSSTSNEVVVLHPVSNFEFIFPRMPLGDYIISVACATGSQLDHEIKLWAHNALSISNIENHFSVGLVGLDSLDCTIQKVLKK